MDSQTTRVSGNLLLNAHHDGTGENWCYEAFVAGRLVGSCPYIFDSAEEALDKAEEEYDEPVSKR